MTTTALPLQSKVEAVLFKRNEPTSLGEIAKILETEEREIKAALDELERALSERGINLLQNGEYYSLVTAKGASKVMERLARSELDRELGKASLETLSIILYSGPISRREIDYIRGVNSTFVLRSLMMRGLIERNENTGGRAPLYRVTSELLAHLGMTKITEMPEYTQIKAEFEKVSQAKDGEANEADKL